MQVKVHGTVWADVDQDVSDISITMNHVDDIPHEAVQLWAERLVLVCAPGFEVEGEVLSRPDQLPQAQRIQVLGRPIYWELIAKHFGVSPLMAAGQHQTDVSTLALELAAEGMGCVALPRAVALPYIKRGLVVEPIPAIISNPWVYCATFKDRTPSPAVKLFKSWLLNAAAQLEG